MGFQVYSDREGLHLEAPLISSSCQTNEVGPRRIVTHRHEPDTDTGRVKLCDPDTSSRISEGFSGAVRVRFGESTPRGNTAAIRAQWCARLGEASRHHPRRSIECHLVRVLQIETFDYVDFTT